MPAPQQRLRPRRLEEAAVHVLVEGFDVFGVQVQYWMLVAVTIIIFAVIVAARSS